MRPPRTSRYPGVQVEQGVGVGRDVRRPFPTRVLREGVAHAAAPTERRPSSQRSEPPSRAAGRKGTGSPRAAGAHQVALHADDPVRRRLPLHPPSAPAKRAVLHVGEHRPRCAAITVSPRSSKWMKLRSLGVRGEFGGHRAVHGAAPRPPPARAPGAAARRRSRRKRCRCGRRRRRAPPPSARGRSAPRSARRKPPAPAARSPRPSRRAP
jgi:hypothetical protein